MQSKEKELELSFKFGEALSSLKELSIFPIIDDWENRIIAIMKHDMTTLNYEDPNFPVKAAYRKGVFEGIRILKIRRNEAIESFRKQLKEKKEGV